MECTYRIKYITYEGSTTPVLLQDVNGPCPILSIANTLLLRGAISLPENVGEISQERVCNLVADRLLHTLVDIADKDYDEDYKANLQHNLSDAISLLPKLTTGVDVNVRFNDIKSFEFTDETAIFDLLNMDLVHGWLCDPQDEPTAAAIGRQSYNELVANIITILGDEQLPRRSSTGKQQQLSLRSSGTVLPNSSSSGNNPPAKIDADMLAVALENTLKVNVPPPGLESPSPEKIRSTGASIDGLPDDSVAASINRMMREVVQDAFRTPQSQSEKENEIQQQLTKALEAQEKQQQEQDAADAVSAATGGMNRDDSNEGNNASTNLQMQQSPFDLPAAASSAQPLVGGAQGGDSSLEASTSVSASHSMSQFPSQPATPPPSTASSNAVDLLKFSGTTGLAAVSEEIHHKEQPEISKDTNKDAALRDALLCRDFLDANPSQLTYHGLAALHDGLREGQLATFFRNNHFNVILKHGGQLYILVTDEGYRFEPDVVWERLSGLDGDTELVNSKFEPFRPHAEAPQTTTTMINENNLMSSQGDTAAVGHQDMDADLALAMQLQQEEDDRARQHEEQQQAQQQNAESQQQQSSWVIGGRRQGSPSQQTHAARPQGTPPRPPKKDKSSDCCIQ